MRVIICHVILQIFYNQKMCYLSDNMIIVLRWVKLKINLNLIQANITINYNRI